jgi:hypothetical protein
MAFTDTHIISLYYHYQHFYSYATLIQFLAIPSDGSPVQQGIPTLCLTHEGFTDERLSQFGIINFGVDRITGATRMSLIDYTTQLEKDLKITCVHLVLPQPRGDEVSLISVDDMPMNNIKIPKQGLATHRYTAHSQYLDVCDGTQLRGFCRAKPKQEFFEPIEIQHVMKFLIDTRQDPWAITWSEIAPAEWKDAADPEVDTTGRSIVFDGLRGRLCYVHPEVEGEAVVVEIE